jgi:Protein of unknown function (DUF2637)
MTALTAPPASCRVTAVSGTDRAIRLSTAAAVLDVAAIAAYVSYWHAYAVVRAYGESGITARLEPATIDGLVYASSMATLYAARHRVPVPALARWLLALGIAATLTANMAQGWSHGPAGAVVAAWPAVSLVGSAELLVWMIRTFGTLGCQPVTAHSCESASCRPGAHCGRTEAAGSDQQSGPGHQMPATRPRPSGQPGGRPAASASVQHDAEVSRDGGSNDVAVAAYRLSVKAGNPLSERKLARMFGHTSRCWARARIAEARQSP